MWLRHGTGEMTPDPLETNARPGPELPRLDTPRNVEVLGVVAGGEDDWFDLNGTVIDYVRQPPGIAKPDQVFALYVVGDSMSPRYDPGDLVYVHKSRPPAIGSDVVVEMHPEGEGQPPRAMIKRLVRRGATVELRQFNPQKTIELPARQVKQVLRILTNAEIMGV
jgi:phage repressor protein C with HTH and peptisase S24 domain